MFVLRTTRRGRWQHLMLLGLALGAWMTVNGEAPAQCMNGGGARGGGPGGGAPATGATNFAGGSGANTANAVQQFAALMQIQAQMRMRAAMLEQQRQAQAEQLRQLQLRQLAARRTSVVASAAEEIGEVPVDLPIATDAAVRGEAPAALPLTRTEFQRQRLLARAVERRREQQARIEAHEAELAERLARSQR